MLRRLTVDALEVSGQIWGDFLILQLQFAGTTGEDPARDVFGQTDQVVDGLGDVVLGVVCQDGIGQVTGIPDLETFSGSGHTAGEHGFGKGIHVCEFVLHMRDVAEAIVGRHQVGRGNQHIGPAGLAASRCRSVAGAEHIVEFIQVFHFTAHENPFPGDEDVVENDDAFMNAVLDVPEIDLCALDPPVILGLSHGDVDDAGGVAGNGTNNDVILVALPVCRTGQHQLFVGQNGAGLAQLRAFQDDPVLVLLHHLEVHFRVGLIARLNAPISLRVGDGRTPEEVFLLHHLDPVQSIVVVPGSLVAIDFLRDVEQRRKDVLGATEGTAAQVTIGIPSDADLPDEIIRTLGDVLKARDGLTRQVRFRDELFLKLRFESEFIRLRHGVNRRTDPGMIIDIGNLAAVDVQFKIHRFDTVDVFLACFHSNPLLYVVMYSTYASSNADILHQSKPFRHCCLIFDVSLSHDFAHDENKLDDIRLHWM